MVYIEWIKQLSTSGIDGSNGVATDNNGNVYISGSTQNSLGTNDYAWVARYDTHGNLLWKQQQLGTYESNYSNGVATDNNGNVYLSGNAFESLGINDYTWIAKYNSHGNLIWKQQLDYSNRVEVATDNDGNVYLSNNISENLYYTRITKYNTQGDLLWTQQLRNFTYSNGVATDNNGNVYLSGFTQTNLKDTNTSNQNYIWFPTNDAWVAKYDSHGNLLWTEQMDASPNDLTYTFSNGVATDNNGNVYISGYTRVDSTDDDDAWIAKYDNHGNLLWTEQLGTSGLDSSNGVATDNEGNVYISGTTTGNLGDVNTGGLDAWVAKYDTNGNLLWTEQLGTSGLDFSNGVATDNEDNIFISGFSSNNALTAKISQSHISINRFQNSNVPSAYLYAGEEESQSIRTNFPNFVEEEIAFYVYPSSANIGVDFYRFQNLDIPGTYIFVGPEERQNILNNFPNFVEEGIAFEVGV